MGTLKENFYKKLNSNFKEHLKNSAIFAYLDEESSLTADNYNGSGKLSLMARLKYYNRLVTTEEITVYEYICELINLIATKPKLYTFNDLADFDRTESKKINNLDSINKNIISFLNCTEDVKPAPITKKSEAAVLANAMAEKIKTTDMSEAFMKSEYNDPMKPPLKSLYDYLLDCAFIFEAKAFFYDATTRKNSLNNSARVDKSLLLLEKYFNQKNLDPFSDDFNESAVNLNYNSADIIDSDKFANDCQNLYRAIINDTKNKSSYENTFIPLYRDQTTGCTFAIVGKNHYIKYYEARRPELNRAFKDYSKECPIVFSALDLYKESEKGIKNTSSNEQNSESIDISIPSTFKIRTSFNRTTNYKNTLERFKNINNAHLLNKDEFFNPVLPKDTPDCFKKYFRTTSSNITPESTKEQNEKLVGNSLEQRKQFKKGL